MFFKSAKNATSANRMNLNDFELPPFTTTNTTTLYSPKAKAALIPTTTQTSSKSLAARTSLISVAGSTGLSFIWMLQSTWYLPVRLSCTEPYNTYAQANSRYWQAQPDFRSLDQVRHYFWSNLLIR